MRGRTTRAFRDEVLARDGYRCRRCGTAENLGIDHIVPLSAGGPTEMANLQTLCRSCNASKGGVRRERPPAPDVPLVSEGPVKSLRQHRAERLLSLQCLADLAQVAKHTVHTAESGGRVPSLGSMRRLSAALGVPPQEVAEFAAEIERLGRRDG